MEKRHVSIFYDIVNANIPSVSLIYVCSFLNSYPIILFFRITMSALTSTIATFLRASQSNKHNFSLNKIQPIYISYPLSFCLELKVNRLSNI